MVETFLDRFFHCLDINQNYIYKWTNHKQVNSSKVNKRNYYFTNHYNYLRCLLCFTLTLIIEWHSLFIYFNQCKNSKIAVK